MGPKLRGALLPLNGGTYSKSDQEENILHYALAEFRQRHLGRSTLTLDGMAALLKGREYWLGVARYAYHAWKYRASLVGD